MLLILNAKNIKKLNILLDFVLIKITIKFILQNIILDNILTIFAIQKVWNAPTPNWSVEIAGKNIELIIVNVQFRENKLLKFPV